MPDGIFKWKNGKHEVLVPGVGLEEFSTPE
jgi:hypothetical protein